MVFFANRRALVPGIILVICSIEQFQAPYGNSKVISNTNYEDDYPDTKTTKGNETQIVIQNGNDESASIISQKSTDESGFINLQNNIAEKAQDNQQVKKNAVASVIIVRNDSVVSDSQTQKGSVASKITQTRKGNVAPDITKFRTTQISSVKIQRKQSKTISQGQHMESNRDINTIKFFTNKTQYDSVVTQQNTVLPGHLTLTTPSNESTFPYTDNITCSVISNTSYSWIFNPTNSTCPNITYDNITLHYYMYNVTYTDYFYNLIGQQETFSIIFKSTMHFAIGIIGLIGNTLTLIILYKSVAKYSTTSFLFTSLSISDIFANTILLIEIVFVDCLGFQSILNVFDFIDEIKPFLSNWILALVTLSRCVSVRCPFSVKTICSFKVSVSAVVTVVILYIGHIFMNIYYIEFQKVKSFKSLFLYLSINILLQAGIPCLIIITCNVIIIQQLYQSYKRRQTMTMTSTDGHEREITITVVHITLIFVCLTVPYHIYRIYLIYLTVTAVYTGTFDSHELFIAQAQLDIAYIYQEANFSINFFIYILNGSQFRKEFFSWFKRKQSNKTQAPCTKVKTV